MKRGIIPATVASLLMCAAAHAANYQKYFPIKDGNNWTYQNDAGGQPFIQLSDGFDGIVFATGIPGAQSGIWIGFSGNTLYAWDTQDESWKPFFRFGAPVGTTYGLTLDTWVFLQNVQITVASKSATFTDYYLGQTFTNCIRFTFSQPGGIAVGGTLEMVFAPSLGLVGWTEQTSSTPIQYSLTNATLNGRNFGLIPSTTIESGTMTNYAITGTDQVLVINDSASWEAFYAIHKPGVTAPTIKFESQTVLVILAGQRPTTGYHVSGSVQWNYPSNGVKLEVTEAKPGTIVVADVVTTPYSILVVGQKLDTVKVDWKVVTGP